ncbi:MAG TPA: amidohydrolase family protein, partial [Actinopolymorphaceae bacterium]
MTSRQILRDVPLVDGHCHTVLTAPPTDPAGFAALLTESDRPAPPGVSYADSPLGLAVRRWCAPVLDLPMGAALDDYLAQRQRLGDSEVASRLLSSAVLAALLVDTGIGGDDTSEPSDLSVAAGAAVHQVVRLERVAERLAAEGVSADDFAEAYVAALGAASADAVGVKSILAYRYGFELPPHEPEPAAVRSAAEVWLREPTLRLTDPTLLGYLLWCGVRRGLPVQLHTGFGDADIRLRSVDPALLQPFLEAVEPFGTPIVLLHCYPYQRSAGWLAATYPHVYADVGLTLSHVGGRAPDVLAEFLELAPFGKVVFSTDAYRLPELYAVGAAQFRWALEVVLGRWITQHVV